MAQQKVWCPGCRSRYGTYGPSEEPGTRRRICDGKAKRSMVCDSCNRRIDEGVKCAAVTYLTLPNDTYPEWERDYIDVDATEEKTYV